MIIFSVVPLAICLIWIIRGPKKHRIADVTQSQAIVLQAPSGALHIQAITIRFTGTIDGKGVLTTASQAVEVGGDFNLHLGPLECYSTNYFVKYTPKGVTKGRAVIHYKFLDTSIMGEMEREISQEYRTH